MNIFGVNITDHSELAAPYRKFAGQLSKWYGGGELPELAGQDLRFILQLQRQKLQSMGLEMQCSMKKSGAKKAEIGSVSFSDRVFINSIIGGNVDMTRSIYSSQDQRRKDTEVISFEAVIQELKADSSPSADMALCCPHCGAPSTLGELQAGCKYCGTKFLMSELYPRVMNFFISNDTDNSQKSSKNRRDMAVCMAIAIIPMVIFFIISGNKGMTENIFSGIIAGGIVGFSLFILKKLFGVFGMMGRDARGAGKTVSSLHYMNKIKKYDPEFSTEYFRDKVMSLFRMAVYSKDASQLACCKCSCPEKAADIIEADLHNLSVNSCKIKDRTCDTDITLYLDCLHYSKGKFRRKTDKYRMCVRKRIKRPTELGFSFAAVRCPSCGASFDARNVKTCPYCGSEYLHEENDWIITDIR